MRVVMPFVNLRTVQRSTSGSDFVVVRSGMLSWFSGGMKNILPRGLVGWWQGPTRVERLDGQKPKLPPKGHWSHRVNVEAERGFAVRRRLEIPNDARDDLHSAVRLFVKTHTPFSPAELVIVAAERPREANDVRTAYDLALVPRTLLLEALSRQGINLWRTRSIRIIDEQQRVAPVDISFAFLPFLTIRRWCAVLPFVIIVLTAAYGSAMQMSARHDAELGLQAMLDQQMSTLTVLSTEVDKKQGAIAEALASSQVLGSKFSLLDILLRLREVLPPDVEVLAFEQRGDVTRLSVRSPDILGTVKHISLEAHWSAAVDGVIAAGQANGLESAVIALSPEAGR